jgi:5-methylcytosine-specific restriction endonuclease McrA
VSDQSDPPADHWAPRKSFLEPIPELEEAADLLSEAADALMSGDLEFAESLIIEADMPIIGEYSHRIGGGIDVLIHRYRDVGDPPRTFDRAEKRMPSAVIEREVYARDGWRCRICDTRILVKSAVAKMNEVLPEAARWGRKNTDCHHGMAALRVSLDHVLPHSRGGTNDPENLITTCGPCQFGRGYWTLGEVGILDPRERPPVLDEWDGLMRLRRWKKP